MDSRTIDEVCEEAIDYLYSVDDEGKTVSPRDIVGYFVEIQNLYNSGEDDRI